MKSIKRASVLSVFCITFLLLCMGKDTKAFGISTAESVVMNKSGTVNNLPLDIPAKMIRKQVVKKNVGRKTALKVNKNQVILKKGKSVKILSEKNVSGKRWYQISFAYRGKKRTGYMLATEVEMTLKKSVNASVTAKKNLKVRTGASTKKPYLKYNKKVVSLKKGTKVTIRKEYNTKTGKWYRIAFTYKKKKLKGYIQADQVKFKKKQQVTSLEFEQVLTQQGFPEDYKAKLRILHQTYPNWKFKAFHTGLEWSKAIDEEAIVKVGGSPKNLLPNSRSVAWKSYESSVYNWATDEHKIFDGTYWVAASRTAVEYYMDSRNFLDVRGIFQFEALEYQRGLQTVEGVNNILKNTALYNGSYSYVDTTTGQTVTKTYADTFMQVAELAGVSPYHLASRVKQEVVIGTTSLSSSVSGTVPGYEGIYNFFNIGAKDSQTGEAVINGLKFASTDTTYMRPWDNPYKSILGGAAYIGEKYITRTSPILQGKIPQSIGAVNTGQQNTLYLQKFNVTPYGTYTHQYMTNVEAANSESTKVYNAYMGTLETSPLVFTIPVYLNMPKTASKVPNGGQNPNKYLRSLVVNGTTLVTDANAVEEGDGKAEYNLAPVSNETGTILITARSASTSATVTVTNGSQNFNITQTFPYTAQINLNPGINNVTITVTAQNGTTKKYKIVITRAES